MQNLNKKRDNHTLQKGITLIALIITIIVMLILVGVTINVALNGGLFSKAEEAGSKTKIAQIQEALTLKKAEVLAEYDGKAPTDYGITIDHLNVATEIKTQYGNKLIISKDAKLYYDASVVTSTEEQNLFESMGIQAYTENNGGTGTPDFYGVGYEADGTVVYILDNKIMITTSSNYQNDYAAGYGFELNGNVLLYKGAEFTTLSDDFSTINWFGQTHTRNESKIYEYNPTVFNETYNIYLNAFYISENTDNIISTFTDGLDKDSGEMRK